MMPNNKYMQLFPCCTIVKGKQKDAIYDLQREEYYLIPHTLTKVFEEASTLTWSQLLSKYEGEENILKEYLDFLLEKELIIFDEKIEGYGNINNNFLSSSIITNAILDFDNNTSYDLTMVVENLDILRCENIELRFYDKITVKKLRKTLEIFDVSGVRDIEVLLPYDNEFDILSITEIHTNYPRLRKITLHSTPKDLESINLHEEICIIFISETISSENCCGVINQWYMLPKTELFLESQHYNTCLNRKIGIDKFGQIKNCPSFSHSYGLVGDVTLTDVVSMQSFQHYWYIKKDDIEVCRDCELRHMCQDCRVYIENEDNIYSKPQKCYYNPNR